MEKRMMSGGGHQEDIASSDCLRPGLVIKKRVNMLRGVSGEVGVSWEGQVPGLEMGRTGTTTQYNNRALRLLLAGTGLTATALAVLGIFLPLLPTVPLLLLAAACFARSSERFHRWLLEHRRLGPMISGYIGGRGIPMKARLSALGLIWATIPLSAFFLVSLAWVRIVLMAVAIALTIYLVRLPDRESDNG